MSTGSKALDRTIDEWLGSIAAGKLRLPSFQRGSAWDRRRIASMLDTILKDLPLGITLVLDVGDQEKFHSRPLESAPATHATITEHLLDGQQRLTALWRALRDNNLRETYFVHVPELDDDPDNDDVHAAVIHVALWRNDERGRYPRWVDDPVECLRRGLIPVRLLDPSRDDAATWVDQATRPLQPGDDITDVATFREAVHQLQSRQDGVKGHISRLRETLRHYNLPYLRLPSSTPRDVALSVFVNMNTNAKPLSAYDIVVAEMESRTEKLLQRMVEETSRGYPSIARYLPVGNAMLNTAALVQGKQPNERGWFELDHHRLVAEWDSYAAGLGRAVQLLEEARIVDADRNPSVVPLPVVAAVLSDAPEDGDARAVVDRLARRYLWSSFFTSRYENAAATRAAADYRALRRLLSGDGTADEVPVLDRTLYPLPSIDELMAARWPKAKRTLGRAVLAASTYFGARDFADNQPISSANVSKREYHHLFPDKLLSDAGIPASLALNCALITWKTNRTIGRLDPIKYLEARVKAAPEPTEVKDRLESHLVPYELLAAAGPYGDLVGEELRALVKPQFDDFLRKRAELVSWLAEELCGGTQPQAGSLRR